jgi:hypothetical protein
MLFTKKFLDLVVEDENPEASEVASRFKGTLRGWRNPRGHFQVQRKVVLVRLASGF